MKCTDLNVKPVLKNIMRIEIFRVFVFFSLRSSLCDGNVILHKYVEPVIYLSSLQKIIFKHMKITMPVRIIKGQEVLPDGSTLKEYGFTDGSTVNIVIEPDKEISLRVVFGPKEFTYKVCSSMSVGELKQQMTDGGTVGFATDEFGLLFSAAADNNNADIPLLDESLPLHLYQVANDSKIWVVSGNIQIHLVTPRGEHLYKTYPITITVNQMKQRIRLVTDLFKDTEYLEDIWLFLQCDKNYRKLNGEAPLGEVVPNNGIIHFVEDVFFSESDMMTVYCEGKEVDRVGWNKRHLKEYNIWERDTVLSLKLRIQNQLGFPVSCITVEQGGEQLADTERLDLITNTRIEVSY